MRATSSAVKQFAHDAQPVPVPKSKTKRQASKNIDHDARTLVSWLNSATASQAHESLKRIADLRGQLEQLHELVAEMETYNPNSGKRGADAVMALVRLHGTDDLWKVQLCSFCKSRWFFRKMERCKYCSKECRDSHRRAQPDYLKQAVAKQRRYREGLKEKDRKNLRLSGEKLRPLPQVGRQDTPRPQFQANSATNRHRTH
jgi:hypothetical protein